MPIETIVTDDMKTAAALLSEDCRLAGVRLKPGKEEQGICEFSLIVDSEFAEQARSLKDRCEGARRSHAPAAQAYDFYVHLGRYDEAWVALREQVKTFTAKETIDHGRRRTDHSRTGVPASA